MCVCSWWSNTCWMCCCTHWSRSYESGNLSHKIPQSSTTEIWRELTNTPAHTNSSSKPPHNVIVNQVLNLVLPFIDQRYLCCLDIGLLSLRESTSSAPHTCFPCTTATNPPVWEPGEALLLEVEGIQSFGLLLGYWGWCTFCHTW